MRIGCRFGVARIDKLLPIVVGHADPRRVDNRTTQWLYLRER